MHLGVLCLPGVPTPCWMRRQQQQSPKAKKKSFLQHGAGQTRSWGRAGNLLPGRSSGGCSEDLSLPWGTLGWVQRVWWEAASSSRELGQAAPQGWGLSTSAGGWLQQCPSCVLPAQ